MKSIKCVFAALAVILFLLSGLQLEAKEKPNVLFIMIDKHLAETGGVFPIANPDYVK